MCSPTSTAIKVAIRETTIAVTMMVASPASITVGAVSSPFFGLANTACHRDDSAGRSASRSWHQTLTAAAAAIARSERIREDRRASSEVSAMSISSGS